jgi:hypothetical protein
MNAIPIALALVAAVLALYALRIARKARRLAERSIEELTKARGLDFRGMATDDRLRALRTIRPGGLRVPQMTDDEAAGAVAAWNAKKAEALRREVDDAATREPWVRRARPMTPDEADAWVAARTRQLRHDIGEQP